MDAILHLGQTVSAYASLATQNFVLGFFVVGSLLVMAAFNHPEVTTVVASLMALTIAWHLVKQLRRFVRVYFLWPLGRMWYRIAKRPVRLLLGGIMARWKTGIVADRLNDTLESLCYDEHILTPTEYRQLSNLLGKTMGLQDLRARKLSNKKGIQKTVLENIGIMKATPQVPGPPKKVEVDPTYDPRSGKARSLNFFRRNSAA